MDTCTDNEVAPMKWYTVPGKAWGCGGEGFLENVFEKTGRYPQTQHVAAGRGFRVEVQLTEKEAEILYNDLMYRYEVRNDVDPCLYDMHYACKAAALSVLDQITDPDH